MTLSEPLRLFPDRKSGIDPLFGLSAMRDSRAMDMARTKNFSHDKRLKIALKSIEEDEKSQSVRSLSRRALAQDFLENINPRQDKRIVCPLGLSHDQKQAVRLMRQTSGPSMTLDEFDQKLSNIRSYRHVVTTKPGRKKKEVPKPMCEFKIKRNIYRRNSKLHIIAEQNTTEGQNVVSEIEAQTHYPLYRRKSVVEETYQRITSADIVHVAGKSSAIKSRSKSEADTVSFDVKPPQSRSSRDQQLPNIQAKRRVLSLRRNTMPESGVSVENNPHLTNALRAMSISKTEHDGNFNKFLDSLSAHHRLPQLQHKQPLTKGDIAV